MPILKLSIHYQTYTCKINSVIRDSSLWQKSRYLLTSNLRSKQGKTRLSFHTSSSVFPSRRTFDSGTGYDNDWCTLFNIARKQTRIRVTGPRTAERNQREKEVKKNTTSYRVPGQRAVSSFSTSNDEPSSSSSSSLPSFSRPVERVQVEAKVKPEESSPAKEVVRVLGSTLKLTPRALARFLSSLRVGGGAPRRNTGCVFRCAITDRLHPDHATSRAPSSFFDPSWNTSPRINGGGRERARRTPRNPGKR